jgi:Zn-dependent protease
VTEDARFKSSVRWRVRSADLLIVDTSSIAPALRLPIESLPFLEALAQGVAGQGISHAQLNLVTQLARYGLLAGSSLEPQLRARFSAGSWMLGAPHRLIATLAWPWRALPSPMALMLLALLLAAASVSVAWQLWAWSSGDTPPLSPWGLLLYALIGIPLHEFSHAVACQSAGVPINAFGLRFKGRLLPSAFTSTNNLALVDSRHRRALTALAGPLFDLCLAGACFAAGRWAGADAPQIAATAGLCALFLLFFNLNPFRDTDGANAVRELYSDGNGVMREGWARAQRRYRVAYVLAYAAVTIGVMLLVSLWLWRGPLGQWLGVR